jgi:hypothetical protein
MPDSAAAWKLSGGPKVIRHFSFRLVEGDPERLLRKCLLSLYFDGASVPQVQAPLGDFFGAAPGLNPFHSLPFSVQTDGTMICRFPMPFAREARIVLENRSGSAIGLSGKINVLPGEWVEGKTMHFTARWHMDHGLMASRERVVDIPYFVANGTGRLVGAAAHLFNPSEAVMPWATGGAKATRKYSSTATASPPSSAPVRRIISTTPGRRNGSSPTPTADSRATTAPATGASYPTTAGTSPMIFLLSKI